VKALKPQQLEADSFSTWMQTNTADTSRIMVILRIAVSYGAIKPDSALMLAQHGLELSKKTSFKIGERKALNIISGCYLIGGRFPEALDGYLQALKIAESLEDHLAIAETLSNIAALYNYQGDIDRSKRFSYQALQIANENHLIREQIQITNNLGSILTDLKRYDSAILYLTESNRLSVELNDVEYIGVTLTTLSQAYLQLGELSKVANNIRRGIPYLEETKNDYVLCDAYLLFAQYFSEIRNKDSTLFYAKRSYQTSLKGNFTQHLLRASVFLANYYKMNSEIDSAFYYQNISISAKDNLYNEQSQKEVQRLTFIDNIRKQELEKAEKKSQTRVKFNMLFGGLFTLFVASMLLYGNNRQKHKSNLELTGKNEKIQSALKELKATQSQLIQAEKMASLGELTAGIAHEIQNPLNFVNNFSELSSELIDEMVEEIANGHFEEVKAIAGDVKQNLEKINHHGKRADGIVKGMLQHSRSSGGQKEPTDVNALADEYLRLAYHGLRAKDKLFNATLKTDFDGSLGKIKIIPQDIGRVILNLINNAFYAVEEKKKEDNPGYEPIVTVSTKALKLPAGVLGVSVSVRDNGNGIPQKALDKIFQPFFTTKPTGQGTGLGLSLAYDIVKAHGGELKVETKEGEGSAFTIDI
jgi:signal transduction histidine kinase